MHLTLAISAVLATWIWGDRQKWKEYHSTMLYVVSLAMIYEFLTKNYVLWLFHPDFLVNQTAVVLVHATITMPLTIFLFLINFPSKWNLRIFHYLKWIGIYIGVECVLFLSHRITYEHHWNLGWSLIFDFIMFPMVRLHHLYPMYTYILSVIIAGAYMYLFHVPVR